MSTRRLIVAFLAGTAAAMFLALAAAALLALSPPGRFAGTGVHLGPLSLLTVSGEGGSTVVELGPGAAAAAVALGMANAGAVGLLARRRA